ncbi:MAG TPA: Ig-like domain-containing protein [Abditibacteriaceae bacterium]|jgi:hypothetical protein
MNYRDTKPGRLKRPQTYLYRPAYIAWGLLGLASLTSLPPAHAATSNEFTVNTSTMGKQNNSSVDGNANGDFVVVWADNRDEFSTNICAQRFNADGGAKGSEILVHSIDSYEEIATDVAVDDSGNFVVIWDVDDSTGNTFVRRFNANGAALAPTSTITDTSKSESQSIDMDDNGNFVIAWERYENDEYYSDAQIIAQRFDAEGVAQGDAIEVTTLVDAGTSYSPDVAMNSSGEFIIAYDQYFGPNVVDADNVLVQRFDASGARVGSPLQADQSATELYSPAASLNDKGNIVVVWDDYTDNEDNIRGRELRADGTPTGDEFLIDDVTEGYPIWPEVALNDNNQYVVIWTVPNDDNEMMPVLGKRFLFGQSSSEDTQFQINGYGAGAYSSSVAVANNGTFLVAWENFDVYTDESDIHGRLLEFAPPVNSNTPPVANNDTDTVLEDSGATTINVLTNDTDADSDTLTLLSATGGTQGGVVDGAPGGTTLTYTPPANFFGTDTFTYTVQDGKGGTNTATVTVTVLPVNDAPSFALGANQTVSEDEGTQTVSGFATNISPGAANESNQRLTFIVTNDNNALFAVQPAIDANGTLTYTLAPNKTGIATIMVVLRDNGGMENGGKNTSPAQTFTIMVAKDNSKGDQVSGSGKLPALHQTTKGASFNFDLKRNKKGDIQGQVEVDDLPGNRKFKSTGITKMVIYGTQSHIEGVGTIKGVGNFTFTLDVNDLDKSNTRHDTFNLQMSNSMSLSSTIASGDIKVKPREG